MYMYLKIAHYFHLGALIGEITIIKWVEWTCLWTGMQKILCIHMYPPHHLYRNSRHSLSIIAFPLLNKLLFNQMVLTLLKGRKRIKKKNGLFLFSLFFCYLGTWLFFDLSSGTLVQRWFIIYLFTKGKSKFIFSPSIPCFFSWVPHKFEFLFFG